MKNGAVPNPDIVKISDLEDGDYFILLSESKTLFQKIQVEQPFLGVPFYANVRIERCPTNLSLNNTKGWLPLENYVGYKIDYVKVGRY